jgi:riboflavin kinase/FMN adenylyltransferase
VLRVCFLGRLRDEKKFASLEDLKSQIAHDERRAQRFFERRGVRRSLAIQEQ